jgi:hypothetical protein
VPVPLIKLADVLLFERLKTTAALFVILPLTEPAEPPFPICRVPAETSVLPE